MEQILLPIIALVIIIVFFVLLVSRREAGRHGTGTGDEFVGICKSAIETASQKETRKAKVMELLQTNSMSNAEIRKVLGVSGRSVQRYLDALEKEGKVEQVGDVGRNVIYRLK